MKLLTYLLFCLTLASCVQTREKNNTAKPSDELDSRIKLASDRLVFGKEPQMTENFLLAGVTLDTTYGVRFADFSGDQAGRYLSTFSRIKVKGNPINLDDLVEKIIATQKPDGRFGNPALVFDPNKLTGEHMALLWGNGRLLTGLMDYYVATKNPEALQSAIKLGNFFINIAPTCTRPDVIEKFKTMGALGFICFTQITDGLVKLYQATSDKKYLALADSIYPLLPEFGNQHSHGYLNTILGVVELYNVTKDTSQLHFAQRIYHQVVTSDNYLITGGVPEFFGNTGFADGFRDEGCSEGDFVMLSLDLWKATNNMDYLDKAEYCLLNELMYNQYRSGDFGSHPIDKNFGFTVSNSQGRAWWCCDYHGLQAMLAARDIIVTANNGVTQVNLYSYKKYKSKNIAFTLKKVNRDKTKFRIVIDSSGDATQTIALRAPSWASATKVSVNGKETVEKPIDGYIRLKQRWKKGNEITIEFVYKLQFVTFDRKVIPVSEMPEKLEKAALVYGPYLLSVDDAWSLPFMSEPAGGNIIYFHPANFVDGKYIMAKAPDSSNVGEAYLKMDYKHEGYYADGQVTMRPVSEVTYGQLPNVRLWFNFERK